jgi:hypothetical protein
VIETKVVHCKREKFDVYIGRPSKWGNPLKLDRIDDTPEQRAKVIADYEAWLQTQPHLLKAIHELRGKVLGCWCSPKACHGDVLARLANEMEARLK